MSTSTSTRLNHYGWKTYLGDIYGTDEGPAYAAAARQSDFSNLPPAYTFVCTGEPFYCETLSFVENLRAAGVKVRLDVYEGLYLDHILSKTSVKVPKSRTK